MFCNIYGEPFFAGKLTLAVVVTLVAYVFLISKLTFYHQKRRRRSRR